jgi:hypothetical protein
MKLKIIQYFEQFQTQEEKDRIQKIKNSMTKCYSSSYPTGVDDAIALKDSLIRTLWNYYNANKCSTL